MMPAALPICFLRTQSAKSSTVAAMLTRASNTNARGNGTGIMSPERPTMNKMLKMLLPTMLPMAISALPLRAAITEVKSSGSEVPRATTVRPMNLSLTPAVLARKLALFTVN